MSLERETKERAARTIQEQLEIINHCDEVIRGDFGNEPELYVFIDQENAECHVIKDSPRASALKRFVESEGRASHGWWSGKGIMKRPENIDPLIR